MTAASWVYTDADGAPALLERKFPGKRFAVYRPDGADGWLPGLNGATAHPLYRLPAVVAAVAAGEWVVVTEGAKDADTAVALGHCGTSAPLGAGKWSKADSSVLDGGRVAVIPDNDGPGRKHAAEVAADLATRAAEVRIVDLPDLPPSGDLTDWAEAGGTAADLAALIDAAPPADLPLTDLPLTDIGNAERLWRLTSDELRYVPRWGTWLTWDGQRWRRDPGAVTATELGKRVAADLYRAAADETDGKRRGELGKWAIESSRVNRINAALTLARGLPGCAVDHEALDADPLLLGVTNGVVDLRTGEHRPGDPADLITRSAGVPYSADAEAPTFDRCLREWFPDPATRGYLQRLAGSALIGDQSAHLFAVHYGTGANGKSTFVRALDYVFGDYYCVPDKSLIVAEKHDRHPTAAASLFRIRLAVAAEVDALSALNEAAVKNLTGGDRITARRMREDFWHFDPTHSLWLQSNYLPRIRGDDLGIWRRVRVVPWHATIPPEAQDPDLDVKLRAEGPGILRWLLDGCAQWQAGNRNEPPQVRSATAAYRTAQDTLGRFATSAGLHFDPALRVTAADLRERLDAWAKDEGEDAPPWAEVAAWLRSHGATNLGQRTIKGRRASWWEGAGLEP